MSSATTTGKVARTDRVSMPTTVRSSERPRYSTRVTRVGQYLAENAPELTGLSWDQAIRGRKQNVPARFAHIVRAAVALRDDKLIARLLAPVDHALTGQPVPCFSPALIACVQTADLIEDQREAAYHANPCRETLRAWLDAANEQAGRNRVLRLAMAEELNRV